jgi:2-keto-3-deoxy-L-rhamnonate aldolase RhmA
MTVVGARSRFESLISAGRKPVGAFLTSSDPSTSVIFGDVGFDFVIIDGEHGALDTRDVLNHIRAARSVGCLAIVRVLHNEAALIQRAVDLGADGVIVPKVGTAGDAERALAATRYQPGGRGFCPMVPAAAWSGENWSEHAGNSNGNVILIPLIETIAGVENFGEIIAVPGIDYAFFGLGDLSQEMGIDMVGGRDQLIAQWEVLRDQADLEGVRLGAPLGFGFAGVDFGAAGGDLSFLRQAAKARLAAAVEELQAGPVAVNAGTSPN